MPDQTLPDPATLTPEQIAAALRAGIASHLDEAAILLTMLRGQLYTRPDIQRYMNWLKCSPTGELAARMLWTRLADDTHDGTIPLSRGERQVIALAASIAAGTPVSLNWALTGLDLVTATTVLHAVGLAMGRRP